MIKLYLTAMASTLIFVSASGCTQRENEEAKKKDGTGLLGDPLQDAEMAIASQDYHLVGVQRFVVVVPGINADYEVLRMRFRIVVIEGTSDIIIENDPQSFNEQAERYAEKYNRRIFAELGCDVQKPMTPCSVPSRN